MGKIKYIMWHMAMAFALFSTPAPMALALEKGRQVAEEKTKSLLEQIRGVPLSYTQDGPDSATIMDDGKTYILTGLQKHRTGEGSGQVDIYSSQDHKWLGTYNFHKGVTVDANDPNRISFDIMSLVPGQIAAKETTGSIIGTGTAGLFSVSTNKGSGSQTSLITMARIIGQNVGQGDGVGKDAVQMVTLLDDIVIIVVVVAFVAITCLLFGWWGC